MSNGWLRRNIFRMNWLQFIHFQRVRYRRDDFLTETKRRNWPPRQALFDRVLCNILILRLLPLQGKSLSCSQFSAFAQSADCCVLVAPFPCVDQKVVVCSLGMEWFVALVTPTPTFNLGA